MPVTVVVGGQFGSEGKGKVAHFLARREGAGVAIRVGGPNSGHTVVDAGGERRVFRQLPTAALLPDVTCVLGAGSYINPQVLFEEVSIAALSWDRLLIDSNAVVISRQNELQEQVRDLRGKIGSTLSGTGAAVECRVSRTGRITLAKDYPPLARFVQPVSRFLRGFLDAGGRAIIEGTQGFGLSLLHSPCYPFVTGRDTTAAGFVSEAGLSPLDVDDVVMVLRAFPIRVGGNSGPLTKEVDWETVTKESGSKTALIEHTSVSKSIRRVARFDPTIVRAAISLDRPTRIAMNHLDYVDYSCACLGALSERASTFVEKVEGLINRSIDFVGFSPGAITANFLSKVNRHGAAVQWKSDAALR